jgi:hypothetical protein
MRRGPFLPTGLNLRQHCEERDGPLRAGQEQDDHGRPGQQRPKALQGAHGGQGQPRGRYEGRGPGPIRGRRGGAHELREQLDGAAGRGRGGRGGRGGCDDRNKFDGNLAAYQYRHRGRYQRK